MARQARAYIHIMSDSYQTSDLQNPTNSSGGYEMNTYMHPRGGIIIPTEIDKTAGTMYTWFQQVSDKIKYHKNL